MSNNKKPQNSQMDFVSPLAEVLEEILKVIIETAILAITKGARFLFSGKNTELKITRKQQSCTKTTSLVGTLGVDTAKKKPIMLDEIDFRRHSFIVGASGFGKTNLINILLDHSQKLNKPIIYFDPKGDMHSLESFKTICESYGKKTYIFSEYYPESCSLNPVLEGSINQITDRIMRAFDWSEPYYRDASRRSLTQALKKIELVKIPVTLESVFDELVKMESKENVGLIAKIEAILVSDFGKILKSKGENALTLSKVRNEGACLYIGLSTQGYGETARAIGKIFLGELLYNSYKSVSNLSIINAGLKNPVSVIFDEFGSIVTPEFIELLNKCRSAGMELTMAVQSLYDIDAISPILTKQIIESSSNLFILKQRVDDAASFFAEACGTMISEKFTQVTEDGEKGSKGSVREVNELIVHPDIIKKLNPGQCILLRQGPTKINLVNIRQQIEVGISAAPASLGNCERLSKYEPPSLL